MMRRTAAMALALLLTACGTAGNGPTGPNSLNAPAVKIAVDPGADFSHIRTYSWIGKPDAAPLMQQRIVEGVDSRLQARGWKLVASGNVHVDAHVSTAEKEALGSRSSQVGYLGWGGFGPPAPNTSQQARDTVEVGTLVVDMYDGGSRRELWRGSASGTVHDDPARMNALLQAALDKMFAGFPPGVAAK
jgi:hypothetical protein